MYPLTLYGPWTLKFGQIYSFHHFFSPCLEILIWCLIYMYELQIKFTFCSGPMIFCQVMAKKSGENYIFDQISKSKGHKSAKNHWTRTKRKLDL
jgi:hypothetical protein